MEKSKDAFRTISEVAEWLDVPTHVLRFWESRFTQIKPVKRAGGRRYYRPTDMALLGGIKRLLHDDGLTIRGVQKLLRERGVRHVAALSPTIDGAPAPLPPAPSGARKSKQDAPPDRWPFTEEAAQENGAGEKPAAQQPSGTSEAETPETVARTGEASEESGTALPQPHETAGTDAQPDLPGTEEQGPDPSEEPAEAGSNVTPFTPPRPAAEAEPPAPELPAAPAPAAPDIAADPPDPADGATVAPAVITLLRHAPRDALLQRGPDLKPLHDRLAALRAGPFGDSAV